MSMSKSTMHAYKGIRTAVLTAEQPCQRRGPFAVCACAVRSLHTHCFDANCELPNVGSSQLRERSSLHPLVSHGLIEVRRS